MANVPSTTKNIPGQGGQQGTHQSGQQGHQGGNEPKGRTDEGIMGKAREAGSAVLDKAKDAAGAAGEYAGTAAGSVAGGMKSLAGTIRENLPREGVLGTASRGVADSLESGGRYLQEEGLGGMMDDLSTLVRRNPLPALCVGIGLGFLLARMTRS